MNKKKSKKKINYKKPKECDRIFWNGFIFVNEEDLKYEGKMRLRLGSLFPENWN